MTFRPFRGASRAPTPLVQHARSAGLGLLFLGLLAVFVGLTVPHRPVSTWLFWRYAGYWIACAYWGLGCLSTGELLVRRLFPVPLPLRERLGISFAAGVFIFTFVASIFGFFYLYHPAFFFLVPAAMIAAGGKGLFETGRRALRHLRAAHRRAKASPWWVWPLVAFGVAGFGMLYFLIMTPDNVQFDSRWKHFALAEQYVVTHGVRRFPEGWTVETNPHLATYVYLWGFMLPFGQLFDRVELAAHMEFFIFVVTTLGISALVRKLVPGLRARHAWVARFLFPGVLLYDSSLAGGADHIAGLFIVPVFLLLLRSMKDLSWRRTSLLALMLAGAAMVKLTTLLMFLPVVALVLGVRSIWLLLQAPADVPNPRRAAWLGPLAAVGVGLVATSTFWLKNWIWYGDPIYPSLYKHLTLRPWNPDAPDIFEWGYKAHQFWRPTRDLDGVLRTLKALVDFSFIPNDYSSYHGKVPVFGSLFTLSLPALFLLRRTKRIWALAGSVHVALFVWYWIHHQDRYIQPLVPWMAAVTAATLILAWRTGLFARIGASFLVAYQIVWGGDVYFIPTHAMTGSPVKATIDLIAAGRLKKPDKLAYYKPWVALGKKLPKGARVMLHDNHVHLGIAAQTVSDWNGWQFGISYARHASAPAMYELMRSLEVTDIVWPRGKSVGWDSLAGDIAFFSFAMRDTVNHSRSGNFEIAKMPKTAPTSGGPGKVAFLGCNNRVKDGLYELMDLHVLAFGPTSNKYPPPRERGSDEELVAKADVVVLQVPCKSTLPAGQAANFQLAAKRNPNIGFKGSKSVDIWLRRLDVKAPTARPRIQLPREDEEPFQDALPSPDDPTIAPSE